MTTEKIREGISQEEVKQREERKRREDCYGINLKGSVKGNVRHNDTVICDVKCSEILILRSMADCLSFQNNL